ncbi:MAG: chemotaxis protein CheW [Desulfobacterales bacterium]|nr:chemotaxis protein CheW [Desulfobacterales bacterium]
MTVADITETSLYLTFRLEEEIFAIDVAKVREVLDLSAITKVPHAPDFIRGMINVRGNVVPVMDMRAKFGLPLTESTVNTRIIIMELSIDGSALVLGAIADSVNDVLELEPDQIEEAPSLGNRWRSDFIKGIGKRNDAFIIILDIDKVLSSDEMALVQSGGAKISLTDEDE